MRTPPHLPGRARHESLDGDAPRPRRHPYALREFPVQTPPPGTLDLPELSAAPDLFTEQRLLEIREMSHQAIGSIDDLLQHTA
ncbi:hypothetical protein MF672_035805 [Actinomadura sp. ATCC 31491]|uniref:Uncharacterized protein n=1 Tax=Actinomadura luzonensis TaxID=2805427 RepID=A0ABT0G3F2_9ACTN|nr:hypothetical protein [Actinomadura luzonensis]MCK2219124.1 hypothetical protein [Actinomadura luzonensis]